MERCSWTEVWCSDANERLSSDYFIFACKDLSVYLSLVLSALLIRGHMSPDILVARLIPIPEGRNANIHY